MGLEELELKIEKCKVEKKELERLFDIEIAKDDKDFEKLDYYTDKIQKLEILSVRLYREITTLKGINNYDEEFLDGTLEETPGYFYRLESDEEYPTDSFE